MATPTKAGKSAKWTDELDAEFVVLYAEAAAKSKYVASGGKQLKSKGWLRSPHAPWRGRLSCDVLFVEVVFDLFASIAPLVDLHILWVILHVSFLHAPFQVPGEKGLFQVNLSGKSRALSCELHARLNVDRFGLIGGCLAELESFEPVATWNMVGLDEESRQITRRRLGQRIPFSTESRPEAAIHQVVCQRRDAQS
ncbi:hypothetical protein H257_10767 [Aphanomyces astaci]|uniref:Uncharacterized protein n=1 Tax=Aphanomyces astaci TaxID=112090 RepID=W4G6H0_APHAT|nr:hypothetical protein H257_10767 [Aphanomyces astaci]ETV74634.1 hypothetical protein H257_10767 [Aphanomyces astaci]|eukprot:XP_009835721.1 hypothetical protein H257_10767 [Aphanomyces astaci]